MSFSSGATELKSRPSKSARPRSETNFAPPFSIRSRNTLPVRKVISWPSASRTRVIASSGLIWPVAGVEAIRIHDIGPLIADKRAYVGLPMEATPSGAKSHRPAKASERSAR
jgi:hypothetical protein